MYMSHKKRRHFNDSRFGFVRFKTMEEAMNATKNLNGVRLRGRRLKASIAKYNKKGVTQNGPVLVEMDSVKVDVKNRTSVQGMEGASKRWWKAYPIIQRWKDGCRNKQGQR